MISTNTDGTFLRRIIDSNKGVAQAIAAMMNMGR
jgi:hypothetical protein